MLPFNAPNEAQTTILRSFMTVLDNYNFVTFHDLFQPALQQVDQSYFRHKPHIIFK